MPVDFTRRKKHMARPNLTPLIDVIFMLIVFFLLTTRFVTVDSIQLALISAGDGYVPPERESVTVTLLPGGRFACNRTTGNIEDLGEYLAKAYPQLPEQDILLHFLDKVDVQEVITAMDMIKLSGGTSISLVGHEEI